MDSIGNYIIVTLCKNEGNNLPDLIESMAIQTVRPALWLIVDDGSTDGTPNIIEKAMMVHDWIQSIRLTNTGRDIGLHYSEIMKTGFDYGIYYCREYGIKYDYLGNLDGDLRVPSTFYENLLKEFEKDLKLGVASGGTRHIIGNHIIQANVSVDEPSGGHMLIRRECFEEFGGIPFSYAVDSVMKAKARLRGWKTRRFEENLATEIRDVGTAEGYWKGLIHRGKASYYINLNPFHAMVRIMKYSFKKPYYGGIAFLAGYLGSIIARKEQINDDEIRHYFWNKWKEYL